MNPVSNEPVLLAAVASVVVWVAARRGLDLTADQASVVAGIVLTLGGVFARQLVRPIAKDAPAAPPPAEPPPRMPPTRFEPPPTSV